MPVSVFAAIIVLSTPPTMLLAIVLPVLGVAACAAIVILLLRHARRQRAMTTLYLEADHLEHDLKECRTRLKRAHAAMSMGPGQPADDVRATQAVDAALRELLAHRLWLRDEAGTANQHDLNAAVKAIGQARSALGQQLRALDSAQRALDTAVREKIEDLSQQ
jgi:hypothetical protein